MQRRVKIHPDQIVTPEDFNNLGEFPRAAFDTLVADAIDDRARFAGFAAAVTGPLEVTASAGRLYRAGKVYERNDAGGVALALGDYLPIVTRRVVSVVVWGVEQETAIAPRGFVVDAETDEIEGQAVATESRRFAEVNLVAGTENADPQPPAIDANTLAVAHVVLTPAGIESVAMVAVNRIGSVKEHGQRLRELEVWRGLTGAQVDTLKTDVSGLASRLRSTVRADELGDVAADLARLKTQAGMSDDLSAYGADHFLDISESDTEHPDWLSRIEEGARFPAAAEREANINLLNPLEDRVKLTGNFALPAYTSVPRITVRGNDGEIAIASYSQTTVDTVQMMRTRFRVRYGTSFMFCTNKEWWRSGEYDPVAGLFRREGETFEVMDHNVTNPDRLDRHGAKEKWVRLRQVWYDVYEEPYWEAQVSTETVSGAILAQTFLNAQDGWLTHVNLWFTRVAASGDVRVMICETTNGKPNLERVIAKVQLTPEQLTIYPDATRVPIGPAFLVKGRRYALVLITPGNHFIAYVSDNKFAQGSMFSSTDGGAFFQGDLIRDLAMEMEFARFAGARYEVQLEAILLENGIVNVDVLAEAIVPEGTDLVFEVQVGGAWRALQYYDEYILNGLPALLPFRAVFLGTTDAMPSITFGSASRVTTWRPRTDFKHISSPRLMPGEIDQVEVRLTLEWWDAERHDCDVKLLTGGAYGTVVEPDTVEMRPSLIPQAVELRAYFDLVTPIEAYKIRIDGTTDNAVVTYHVAERIDLARSTT